MKLRAASAVIVLLLAAALVTYGTWQIYEPAGFVVAGLCLAGCGWLALSE